MKQQENTRFCKYLGADNATKIVKRDREKD